MSFNPDPQKPAQKVIFRRKLKAVSHPSITFNNNPLNFCPSQKHLGLVLDSFNEHINHILCKVNKSIRLLRKFQSFLPRSSLLTIYKTFINSHFDYADVVYDQCYKSSFHEKIYQESGLESLQNRRWFRKICQFYRSLKSKSPRYLFNIIPTKLRVHNTRCCDPIPLLKIKHNYFRNSFFPLQQQSGIN